MLFTDAIFLFYFLPLALLSMLALTRTRRLDRSCFPLSAKLAFFALTLVFYGWREPWWLAPFLISIIADLIWGKLLFRIRSPILRRAIIFASVAQNLGLLSIFKYRDLIRSGFSFIPAFTQDGASLAIPAGISFYTFESLSFVIDAYRGQIQSPPSARDFFCFIGMFPRFIAGPIARFPDIVKQLKSYSGMDLERGLQTFAHGFFLKICFADPFGQFSGLAFDGGCPGGTLGAWIGVLAFPMQLYFDFSGYSLMAIGLGRCFGFEFPENFRQPYLATTLTDFWRRWHRTLGLWMRDYLYIPMGGNRSSKLRQQTSLFATMLIAGIWHGPALTFAAYGAWNGVFLCIERLRGGKDRPGGLPGQLWVLAVFFSSLVFFRAQSIHHAFTIFRALAGHVEGSFDPSWLHGKSFALLASAVGTLYCFGLEGRHIDLFSHKRVAFACLVLALTLAFGTRRMPFIYFQF